jgi:hypothetical protein
MSTQRFPLGPVLRNVADLHDPVISVESAMCLARARVVTADYELIQADFPALAPTAMRREFPELETLEPPAQTAAIERHIDAWLVRHAGVISFAQTQDNPANVAIPLSGERVRVHRPPRYGRALVVPVPGGLLDVKGVGVRPGATPSTFVHHSGLMYLGEALGDLAVQRIIDRIFRHCSSTFWTLPTYAILDLGFDALTGDGVAMPAGAQVRRAHRRPIFGGDRHPRGSLEQRLELEIELILRHYGLTSCNASTTFTRVVEDDRFYYTYGGAVVTKHTPDEMRAIHEFIGPGHDRFEGANIQMTREVGVGSVAAQVVDFGHFELRERFEDPLVSLVSDRLLRWGGVLAPDHPNYVQPVPHLALPSALWGPIGDDGPRLPGVIRQSKSDQLAFMLAARFVANEIDRPTLELAFEDMLEQTCARWSEPAGAVPKLSA